MQLSNSAASKETSGSSPPSAGFGDPHVVAAALGAAALVAQQVMGKALRDALFLVHIGVDHLPQAMLSSAVLSGAIVVAVSRFAPKVSPRRLASAVLCASAALFVLAWALLPARPRVATLVTYFHTGALTPAEVSLFWALLTHTFDARVARLALPRVLGGATLGGVVGGVVTWRWASVSEPNDLLLLGTLLSLAALYFVQRMGSARNTRPVQATRLGLSAFKQDMPYLAAIAAVVALTACTQAILDYLLSTAAVSTLGRAAGLLSFFALFQTATACLSFVLQVALSPGLLERFGVGRILAIAPLGIGMGALLSPLLAPLTAAIVLRGADGVLGASLQRSSYEVLFAPLDDLKRRVSKPILDVAVDRAGTLLGGCIVAAVIALMGSHGLTVLLVLVAGLAALRVALAPILQRGYRRLLADSLRRGSLMLSSESVLDPATIRSLSLAAAGLDRTALLREIERVRAEQQARPNSVASTGLSLAAFDLPNNPHFDSSAPPDAMLAALVELRSGDETRVRAALKQGRSEPLLLPQVLLLLDDDTLARPAADWLAAQEPPPIGGLADALLADRLGARARRRVARIIGKSGDDRAIQCLLDALPKVPTNVRVGVSQALARLGTRRAVPRAPLLATVIEIASTPGAAADKAALEELFTLLAAAYPEEPIQRAYRALSRGDELRGTALEWLDTLLPREVRAAVWPCIAPHETTPPSNPRSPAELRQRLGRNELVEPDATTDD